MTNAELEPDYITAYETAIDALKNSNDSLRFKHKAVLALARSGALEFAEAEYRRFGLDKVKDDEDIMALGARLAKDFALSKANSGRREYGLRSANLYKAAFDATGGFYSGINAATMRFAADRDIERAGKAAQSILELLPETNNLNPEELYFIEATRAEAFLLQQDRHKAQQSLRLAVKHDPLNFTAHASTLRQFRMIESIVGKDTGWLEHFQPPAAVHFCGHLFGGDTAPQTLDPGQEAKLKIDISDIIQKNDIGFGFGALAAGADIIFAESLLEEGGELNVHLPVSEEQFRKVSVAPYGDDMLARYEYCLANAKSVSILCDQAEWPDRKTNALNGKVAMGQAIMRAQHLSTLAQQIAVFDKDAALSQTAVHIADWSYSGNITHIAPISLAPIAHSKNSPLRTDEYVVVKRSDQSEAATFTSVKEAIQSVIEAQHRHKNALSIGIASGLETERKVLEASAGAICEFGFAGLIRSNSTFASVLALEFSDDFQIQYQGRANFDHAKHGRIFTIRAQER